MSRSEFLRAARRMGWAAEQTGGGHLKLSHPSVPRFVITSYSPRCPRAFRNAQRDLERAMAQAGLSGRQAVK